MSDLRKGKGGSAPSVDRKGKELMEGKGLMDSQVNSTAATHSAYQEFFASVSLEGDVDLLRFIDPSIEYLKKNVSGKLQLWALRVQLCDVESRVTDLIVDDVRAGIEQNGRLFERLQRTGEAAEALYDYGIALGEALDTLVQRSQSLLQLVEVARLLGRPYCTRHWERIRAHCRKDGGDAGDEVGEEKEEYERASGVAATPYSDIGAMSLGIIFKSRLVECADEVREIVAKASHEIECERRFAAVQKEWERITLAFVVSGHP